jgi:hypothetical protein
VLLEVWPFIAPTSLFFSRFMKTSYQFIEPLEARIAPAILVNGGNLLGGKGNPTTGQTSTGGNTVTLVKVVSGEALVFFDASNEQITEISVGKGTKLVVTGDVDGDIVTNLLPNGQLTDSDHNPANGQNGGILLATNFLGLTTHPLGEEAGSVQKIIAGGSVSNINISGSLGGIYAGDGIFKTTNTGQVGISTGGVNFNPIVPGGDDLMVLHAAGAKYTATPSISDVTVAVADQLQVFAGDGSGSVDRVGNSGGSISDITVTMTQGSDLAIPAIYLRAGNGANVTTGGVGGAGGNITSYTDVASTSYVKVETGNGGTAKGGTGGSGGSFTDSAISSNANTYQILVGSGGAGATGGDGGSISTITFSDAIIGQAPLIATGDFNGDGIQDVLLVNTVTGDATLSEGTTTAPNSIEAPFQVVFHPSTGADGAATTTSFIAPEGSVPTDVVAADLNGDGKLDFVVSYGSTNNLGIFLNQGNGNFTASSVPLPVSPTKIAVGNYLNDGHQDIAILSAGDSAASSGVLASQIYVAEGAGTGTFPILSAPDTFPGVATDLVSGQLDGAGGTDLAVGFKSGYVDTFLANGSTTAAPFTLADSLQVFVGPIANLDIAGTTLLAFTANNVPSTAPVSTTGSTTPMIQLLNVTSTGFLTMAQGFAPVESDPTAARFIGSTDAIGVVFSGGVSIYTPVGTTYESVASVTSDGQLTNFVASLTSGGFQIDAVGASPSRFFSTTGYIEDISGVGSLLPFDIPGKPFVTTISAGAGGAGIAHDGGTGGSISGLTFTQTLGAGIETAGARFNITISTGAGGTSKGAFGGDGGAMQSVALSLNPADYTGEQDSTTFVALTTGSGGNGAIGGSGGNMSSIKSSSIFDQIVPGGIIANSVALELETGNGGNGSSGAGGAGGSITLADRPVLSGVSCFDPDSSTPFAPGLLVESGNGGNGATTGGDGGALVNIQTQNAPVSTNVAEAVNELGSASIISGSGGKGGSGAGGNGGAITGLDVVVQSQTFNDPANLLTLSTGGALVVTSGSGGASNHKAGGSGGAITDSTVASVDGDGFRNDDPLFFAEAADPYFGVGVLLHGGTGGAGAIGGGNGGGISNITINSPSATDVYAAILLGGDGGQAVHSGAGGSGGSINGVTQTKDVDSSLNLIQGGDAGAGHRGNGGSVENINTVGFIGLPATETANLGVFNSSVASPLVDALFTGGFIPQGIFAGRGGVGGVSGSVIDVVAQQIAAIGGSVNSKGIFAYAHKVDDIKGDLIGYEVVRNNQFSSTVPGKSPAKATPIDGFILAASVIDIDTDDNARTAKFTFKG